jgi:hypothetical protein
MSEEIDVEPIPGLPHHLPPGEHILWQGRPEWRGLCRHTFQVPWIAAYFGVIAAARGVFAVQDGQGVAHAALAVLMVLPLCALCLGILSLLSWLNARGTMYTITTRRVVMRFGVALPMTFNFPFKRLAAANLKLWERGRGDIALQLSGSDRIAWPVLWPHARPWHFKKAQPMLRCIPDASRVSSLLAEAVRTFTATSAATGAEVAVVRVKTSAASMLSDNGAVLLGASR